MNRQEFEIKLQEEITHLVKRPDKILLAWEAPSLLFEFVSPVGMGNFFPDCGDFLQIAHMGAMAITPNGTRDGYLTDLLVENKDIIPDHYIILHTGHLQLFKELWLKTKDYWMDQQWINENGY